MSLPGVVVATRDRRDGVLAVLERLTALPEHPPIVVTDNGSSDGTPDAVRAAHPDVQVIALGRNLGAAARNHGARALGTELVAFADDDSWWAPGALGRAGELFDGHPRLALLNARILVGPDERPDPVCEAMADSPLGRAPDLPGPSILGFVACGAVLRRDAFLAAGGFHPEFGVGGEEEVLAADLASRGHGLGYVAEVVAHHHPAASGPRRGRDRTQLRNSLWAAWLRRPASVALRLTAEAVLPPRPASVAGLAAAAAGLPWVLRERRPVPPAVEHDLRALEQATDRR